MHMGISIATGDITCDGSCAIVNAANSSLMGGGGVDGAIHRAGGRTILDECRLIRSERYPDGLPTGQAVATTAGSMPSRYVIHTVGPIYPGCGTRCDDLLGECYTNSLKVACELGCGSIAFPAISTGIYGFPRERAARVAYKAVCSFLDREKSEIKVIFVFHSAADRQLFEQAVEGV